jgi:hypothetical protein
MLTLGIDIGIHNFSGSLVTAEPTPDAQGSKKTIASFVISLGDRKDPIDKLLTALTQKIQDMNDVFNHPELGRVIIEQQLGLQATKNYAISSAVYMHYANLRLTRASLQIQFSNPRCKFTKLSKIENVPGVTEHSARIRATKGPHLKKLSVEMASALATHWQDAVFLEYLASLPKKDDVCDSWLMAALC